MEISPELLQKGTEFGIVAVAHLGILLHREWRKRQQLPSRYHQVALFLEHVISYATRPYIFTSIGGQDSETFSGIISSSLFSLLLGVIGDGFWPHIKNMDKGKEGGAQWDQLAADFLGVGIFNSALALTGNFPSS